jgi:hypothetical protein
MNPSVLIPAYFLTWIVSIRPWPRSGDVWPTWGFPLLTLRAARREMSRQDERRGMRASFPPRPWPAR